MSTVQPRKLVHRGHVEASGYLFDTQLIGVAETRRRILNLWAPGVQVYAHGVNYFVRLPAPVLADCAHAPGTPLVSNGNVLAALPLAADELSALDAPAAAVVYVRGGCASVAPLNTLLIVSPESWLDISQFEMRSVNTLGIAYEAPEVVAEPLPFDARAKLEGAPKETPELLETIAAFRTRKLKGQENAGRTSFGVFASGETVRSILDTLRSILSSAAKLPVRLWREQSPSGQRASNRESDGVGQGSVAGTLRRFAVRLLHRSRLTKVLGRRQAAYMAKMMAMFEEGNLDDALRHAVPLSDVPPALDHSAALGIPAPRTSLSIIPRRSSSSLLIGAEDNVMSYLRQLYRSAFERLVAQGRIEEAAFVLAELLRSNEEAVAFLERHGKLRLAAELAEARELPPGLVVRQWFLAGENKRAIRIALRTQAFADAVLRLEKTNKEQAVALRLLWAEVLADAGNYAGAVDVLWPLTNERLRAREWMDRAIDVGGPVAARMLARKLSLVPEEFEDVRDRCLTFLEDENFEQRTARLLFARTLCQGERNAQTRTLARATTRAILRDAGQDYHAFQPKEFRHLVDFSGDGALRADVPPLPTNQGGWSGETLALEFADADRGALPIPDAALLGDGRMLVALGEAGVRLLTRDGRTITHFDQPAHRLVLSDHGDRAIALAKRGEVWRLVHLDLLQRSATDWCEARIDAFAPSFDGSLWFIGAKGDFYAIDANAAKFEALWRVPEAGESVIGVARSASSCSFLTTSAGEVEQWIYRLPLLTLRSRTKSVAPPSNVLRVNVRAALSAAGVYVDQSLYCPLGETEGAGPDLALLQPLPVLLRVYENGIGKDGCKIGDANTQPGQPEIFGKHVVSPVYEDAGARVRVIDLAQSHVKAELLLAKAKDVSTKLTDTDLTIADDCGRLIVIDLVRNCLVRNLRV